MKGVLKTKQTPFRWKSMRAQGNFSAKGLQIVRTLEILTRAGRFR